MSILFVIGLLLKAGYCMRFSLRNVQLWIAFLWMTRTDVLVCGLLPFVGHETRAIIQDRPGCYMDGIYRPFGSRWSPVFEPQGLMVCVKCECLSVEKKGIAQTKGEIVCRNIKDLCPEPECAHPILKPGRCCKACPGKDDFESSLTLRKGSTLPNDIYTFGDAPGYETQEYHALLVGRHVIGDQTRTRAVAVAHIRVNKGKLQFALRYSRLDRPRSFMLQDIHGNVLFERPIQNSHREKKICGSWSKIPGFYLRYFRQQKLYATLTTTRYPSGIVSGKIIPKSVVSTETFSAILTPSKPDGNGGWMQMDYVPETKLLTFVMTFEALRGTWKKGDFQVAVLKGSKVVYQTGGSLLATTGTISGSWKLSEQHRKQLARGRLNVRVSFSDLPNLKGVIQPRLACGVFQAVMSSGQTFNHKQNYASGSAVLQLGEDGRLDYSIKVFGLTDNITRIRLESDSTKYNHLPRFVGNLFKSHNSSHHFPLHEWTNGTYKKLEAEDVFNLLNNQLYIKIVTTQHKISQLRGRLVSFEYDENFINSAVPVSLVPVSESALGNVAHTWLSLDADCVLHFDATVADAGKKPESFDVVLGSHSNRQRTFTLRQPMGKLGDIIESYRHTAGEIANIPDDLLLALDRGQAFVQINSKKSREAIFTGNVTLANACWRYSNDIDVDYTNEDQTDFLSMDRDRVPVCNFEGHNYEEGSTWLPDVNPECTTCSCVAGKTLCQQVICPTLTCKTPVLRSGDCCPSCPYEDDAETCQIGKDPRKYRVHSTWHPYLPMEGFTKCAICRCFPGGKVDCDKSPCPVLNCPKSRWVKSVSDPCCYECSSPKSTETSLEEPQQDQNVVGACVFLDKTKSNGEKWHPNIQPFGHMKCFLCECQDGTVNCGRTHCPELKCSHKIKPAGKCCEECDASQEKSPAVGADHSPLQRNENRTNKGCRFGEKQYRNGQRWQPISSPAGNGDCAVCQCKDGSAKCRLRCPRVCQEDLSKNPCCKHCSDKIKAKGGKRNSAAKTRANTGPTDPTSGEAQGNGSRLEQGQGQNKQKQRKRPGLLDRLELDSVLT